MNNATTRRTFLTAAACAALLPASGARAELPSVSAPGTGHLAYDLTWTGLPVGTHTVSRIDDEPGAFRIVNRVEIVIDLLLFDAMRFEHESTEVWRDGRLTAITSRTLDNGDLFEFEGHSTDEGLALWGSETDTDNPDALVKEISTLAPHDVITTHDIWIAPQPGSRPVLNVKNGEVVTVTVSEPVAETVAYQGDIHSALRYRAESPVAIGSVVYLGDLFVKGWFERRGRTVHYSLV